MSLLSAGFASAADGGHNHNPLGEHVRAGNDRFKDVAVAASEGYASIPCAGAIEGGAMGVYCVNAKLIGDSIDIDHPQAVMYEPMPDGKMELIAVEYSRQRDPRSLEGQLFNFSGAPNRYGLGPVLRAARLGLEGEPTRHLRGYESEGHLRARVDEVAIDPPNARRRKAASSIVRANPCATIIQQQGAWQADHGPCSPAEQRLRAK